MIKDFIALDLETTGLDYESDKLIEIAMARFRNGVQTESYTKVINPETSVRPFILELTGIDNAEIQDAPVFSKVANEIQEFIGDDILIAHNAAFDIHFLKKSFKSVDKSNIPNFKFYDSLLASRIAWCNSPNHRLETLVKFLNLEKTMAHRALPDAIHAGEVFLKAQEEYASFPSEVQNGLAYLAQNTSWQDVFEPQSSDKLPTFSYQTKKTKLHTQNPHQDIPDNIQNFFGQKSPLTQVVEGFQKRPNQDKMAHSVLEGLQNRRFTLLEGGTGSGKTLAYLSAAANYLNQHPDERIVISTATRALQEQIISSELPRLQKIFGKNLRPVVLKGRDNYICFTKFEYFLQHAHTMLSEDERFHFMTLLPWIQQTQTGDISENSGFNAKRNFQLWNKLQGDSASCGGDNCTQLGCGGISSRQQATGGNLLIINHALFFKEMNVDFGLLPSWDHIIFDEAHRLPEQGRNHLGRKVWFYRLRNGLQKIKNPWNKNLGLLPSLLQDSRINQTDLVKDIENINQAAGDAEKALHRFLMKLGKQVRKHRKEEKILFNEPLSLQFSTSPEALLSAVRNLDELTNTLCEKLAESKYEERHAVIQELKSFRRFVNDFANDLQFLCDARDENWVYWLEDWFNPHKIKIQCAPILPGKQFQEKLYPWVGSICFVSATLSVNDHFDHFMNSVGIRKTPRVQFSQTPSPWERSEKVITSPWMSSPTSQNYAKEVEEVLVKNLPDIPVNTLVLFTSVGALMKAHKALQKTFAEKGRLLLAQHIDGGLENLTDLFKSTPGACLLGTQVFWEGVDLPGKSLELLVIPKLPFPTPNEPVIKALSNTIEASGKNPFTELMIPETALSLRQGMGRLIRNAEDHGAIWMMDSRVDKARYGGLFRRLWKGRGISSENSTHAQELILENLNSSSPKEPKDA